MSTTAPISFDVTEGGIVVRVTDEQGLDLTIPSEKPNAIRANLTSCTEALKALHAAIPEMLRDLTTALGELGQPCGMCDGEQGHEVEGPDGAEFTECPVCEGSGIRPVRVAA